MSSPMLWLAGSALGRERAAELIAALPRDAQTLTLGPAGDPTPDLDLGSAPDLALALEACPPQLRPAALLVLEPDAPPAGVDGMPCPTLAWGGECPVCDAVAPANPLDAAEALALAAQQGRLWPWLERVNVNLPLRDLLGRYAPLASTLAVNPEVGIDHQALDAMHQEHIAQAKQVLTGRRVSVHMPFMDLSPGSPDPAIAGMSLQRLNKAADWALEMGAVRAVVHLGYSADTHRDLEEFCRRLAKGFAPLAQRLHQGGCLMVMENTFEPGPDVLLAAREAIIQAGGPEVGFCLDVGHAYCFSATTLPEWWQALAPHLGELHLHDNDGTFDYHSPPGCGLVDWDFVRRSLAAMDEPPLLTMEPHAEPDLWAFLRGLEKVWGTPPA
ncbi:MAG: sugar phosphate isomerase/epimerase [Desulfarculaceae bacterium]|nr:sugar phosphate isomerase/epimerase [Desulfarculaceae bacterium]MCF8049051.1 sugar phosphate isomerase/epimerase [Desulfarculaceae bacterium]MCF8099376.1 sugar phosphate isomerase/epimerase [Desulfarculaceae bacterium]MCF8123001.1 sugar phosphate isomerase/epimerase [Desulfarculaceae bacterium]